MIVPSEEWRLVEGGLYEVSSLGRIRSLPRVIEAISRSGNLYRRLICGKVLTQRKHRNGYVSVRLAPDEKTAMVSRLVCRAFYGPAPNPNDEADHINAIRDDNRAENLRWLSIEQNRARRKHARGSQRPSAKLNEENVAEIRLRFQQPLTSTLTERDRTIATEFGVSRRAIGLIRLGKTWSHVS